MFAAFRLRRPLSRGVTRRLRIAAGLILFASAVWLESDRAGRGQFDPVSLSVRTRPERTFLGGLVGVPTGPWSVRGPASEPLLAFLVAAGHAAPLPGRPPRWVPHFHWSEPSHWSGYGRDGSGVAYRALHKNAAQLIAWSRANPERAEVWWGRAFALLRSADPVERDLGEGMLDRGDPDAFCRPRKPDGSPGPTWAAAELDGLLDRLLARRRAFERRGPRPPGSDGRG